MYKRQHLAFGAGSLALAGFFLFSGWFSKEELLSSGLALGPAVPWLWVIGVSVNILTSFYIFRVVWLAFRGEPATSRAAEAHEARPVMLIPVVVLAFLAAVVGFLNIDFFGFHPITLFSEFLDPVLGSPAAHASVEMCIRDRIGPVLLAGSLNLETVVNQQHGLWFVFLQPLGFLLYFTGALAETNRLPFDLPEAEAELVAGYHTEYAGMRFGLFFMAEYINMITVSSIATVMFLGGWMAPLWFLPNWLGPVWFGAKVSLLIFVMMWVRWTFPRLRYDRLMQFGWKVLLPLGLVNL